MKETDVEAPLIYTNDGRFLIEIVVGTLRSLATYTKKVDFEIILKGGHKITFTCVNKKPRKDL